MKTHPFLMRFLLLTLLLSFSGRVMAFSSYDIQGPYHSFQHSFIFSKNSIVPVSVAQTQIFQPQGQVASCTISLDAPVVDENGNTHWVQCTATEADCVTAFNVAYQCATILFNVAMQKLDAGPN